MCSFTPDLETIKRCAAEGKYSVYPVSAEMLSDMFTPLRVLSILKNVSTHVYMLESVSAQAEWGRYTFLGYEPKMSLACVDGELKADDITMKTDDPSGCIRELLARYKSPKISGLPAFTGGLVGYFSFDFLNYSEPSIKTDTVDTENFKDVDLMLFDKIYHLLVAPGIYTAL